MKCYTLTSTDRIKIGIPENAYRLSEKPHTQDGCIINATVHLEVLMGLDETCLTDLLKNEDPCGFLYGVPYLAPPAKNNKGLLPASALLVQMDMRYHFCDPTYGDRSRLVCWQVPAGLFLCPENATAIHSLVTDKIFVNRKGVLVEEKHRDRFYKNTEKRRDAERRKTEARLIKL